MLPTVMGTIFLAFLALVVYWFLTIVQKPADTDQWKTLRELRSGFDFEAAPEIMAYPIEGISETDTNNLKLVRVKDSWIACWSIQEGLLREKKAEAGGAKEELELVLRIYESGELLRHHDIKTTKKNGCCRLYLRPYCAYYVSLGLTRSKNFYPLLVSNTIIPNELQ